MTKTEWGITTHFLWPLAESVEEIYSTQCQRQPLRRIDYYSSLRKVDFEYGCEAVATISPDTGDRIRKHGLAILENWEQLEWHCSSAITGQVETPIIQDAIARVLAHNRNFGGHDDLVDKHSALMADIKRFVPMLHAAANLIVQTWLTDARLIHANAALSERERMFFQCLVEAGEGVWVEEGSIATNIDPDEVSTPDAVRQLYKKASAKFAENRVITLENRRKRKPHDTAYRYLLRN